MKLSARNQTITVFAVALLVRLLHLAATARHPEFMAPAIDAVTYHHFARQWIESGLRDSTTHWHAALYPLLLSLIYLVGSPSIFVAKTVQAIFGAITSAGIGAIARHGFGAHAGWIAGLGAALSGPLLFYEQELMPAGLSVTLAALLLHALIRSCAPSTRIGALWRGILAGLALLARPELCAAYLIARTLMIPAGKASRPTWSGAFLGLIAFAAVTAPVAVLNRPFSDGWSILPANGPLNAYLANSGDPCRPIQTRPGPDYDRIVNEPKRAGILNPAEQARYFRRQVMHQAMEHPMVFLDTLARKTLLLLSAREITADVELYSARPSSPALQLLAWRMGPFGFPFGLMFPLAVIGLLHPRRRAMLPITIFALALAASLVLLQPAARYRLILYPCLLAMAGAGAAMLVDCEGRKRGIALAVGAIALLVSLLAPRCEQAINYRAERLRMAGQQLEQPGSPNPWLEQAWRENANDPQTAFFLALNHWRRGDTATAESLAETAVALSPDFAMAHLLVADLAVARGDHSNAIEHLTAATASAPDLVEGHERLAALYLDTGKPDRARIHLERILRIQPDHPDAHRNLAAVLIDEGQYASALWLLETMLRSFPDDPGLRVNAGLACRGLGLHEQARQHWLEARRIDPANEDIERLLQETP